MTVKHESKAGKDHRQQDLTSVLRKELRQSAIHRPAEVVEDEMSDPYWGTTESYWEMYFDIRPRS